MIDVNVDVGGIVVGCDESILKIKLKQGYTFEKIYFNNLPYKSMVTNARGDIDYAYIDSRMEDLGGQYFICLTKQGAFSIPARSQIQCEEQIDAHKEQETEYLFKTIALLRIYHEGNIGLYDLFFHYPFKAGPIAGTINSKTLCRTRNILDERKYVLDAHDVAECNRFIYEFSDSTFDVLRSSIEEFIQGMDSMDDATGFTHFITCLEMTLLKKKEQDKTTIVSNRVAVLIGASPVDTTSIYNTLIQYYRARSKSLHEGDVSSITEEDRYCLEGYVRRVMMKCLVYCKTQLATDPTESWENIKRSLMVDLKKRVRAAQEARIIPVKQIVKKTSSSKANTGDS